VKDIDGNTIIDANAGEIGKLEGITNAETGSGPDWQEQAIALVKKLAESHSYIVSDDLWVSGLTEPGDSRALGAAMVTAKRRGYVTPTMMFVNTHQASRHKAPIRVWRSKLRTGGDFQESRLLSRAKAAIAARETMNDIANGKD
jgi:hypothetical protein